MCIFTQFLELLIHNTRLNLFSDNVHKYDKLHSYLYEFDSWVYIYIKPVPMTTLDSWDAQYKNYNQRTTYKVYIEREQHTKEIWIRSFLNIFFFTKNTFLRTFSIIFTIPFFIFIITIFPTAGIQSRGPLAMVSRGGTIWCLRPHGYRDPLWKILPNSSSLGWGVVSMRVFMFYYWNVAASGAS